MANRLYIDKVSGHPFVVDTGDGKAVASAEGNVNLREPTAEDAAAYLKSQKEGPSLEENPGYDAAAISGFPGTPEQYAAGVVKGAESFRKFPTEVQTAVESAAAVPTMGASTTAFGLLGQTLAHPLETIKEVSAGAANLLLPSEEAATLENNLAPDVGTEQTYQESALKRQKENPEADVVGSIAGSFIPEGAVSRAGSLAGKVAAALKVPGKAGEFLGTAAHGAGLGAALGAGRGIEETELGNPDYVGETATSSILGDTLENAALGAGVNVLSTLGGWGAKKVLVWLDNKLAARQLADQTAANAKFAETQAGKPIVPLPSAPTPAAATPPAPATSLTPQELQENQTAADLLAARRQQAQYIQETINPSPKALRTLAQEQAPKLAPESQKAELHKLLLAAADPHGEMVDFNGGKPIWRPGIGTNDLLSTISNAKAEASENIATQAERIGAGAPHELMPDARDLSNGMKKILQDLKEDATQPGAYEEMKRVIGHDQDILREKSIEAVRPQLGRVGQIFYAPDAELDAVSERFVRNYAADPAAFGGKVPTIPTPPEAANPSFRLTIPGRFSQPLPDEFVIFKALSPETVAKLDTANELNSQMELRAAQTRIRNQQTTARSAWELAQDEASNKNRFVKFGLRTLSKVVAGGLKSITGIPGLDFYPMLENTYRPIPPQISTVTAANVSERALEKAQDEATAAVKQNLIDLRHSMLSKRTPVSLAELSRIRTNIDKTLWPSDINASRPTGPYAEALKAYRDNISKLMDETFKAYQGEQKTTSWSGMPLRLPAGASGAVATPVAPATQSGKLFPNIPTPPTDAPIVAPIRPTGHAPYQTTAQSSSPTDITAPPPTRPASLQELVRRFKENPQLSPPESRSGELPKYDLSHYEAWLQGSRPYLHSEFWDKSNRVYGDLTRLELLARSALGPTTPSLETAASQRVIEEGKAAQEALETQEREASQSAKLAGANIPPPLKTPPSSPLLPALAKTAGAAGAGALAGHFISGGKTGPIFGTVIGGVGGGLREFLGARAANKAAIAAAKTEQATAMAEQIRKAKAEIATENATVGSKVKKTAVDKDVAERALAAAKNAYQDLLDQIAKLEAGVPLASPAPATNSPIGPQFGPLHSAPPTAPVPQEWLGSRLLRRAAESYPDGMSPELQAAITQAGSAAIPRKDKENHYAEGGVVDDLASVPMSSESVEKAQALQMLQKASLGMSQKIKQGASMVVRSGKRANSKGQHDGSPGLHKNFAKPIEHQIKAHLKHAEMVRTLTNPEALADTISSATEGLQSHAPNISTSVGATMTRAAQYLNSKLPEPESRPAFAEPWEPSRSDLAIYQQHRNAIEDPLSVFRMAANGTLTPHAVEAVRAVYPELHKEMSIALMDAATEHKPSYEARKAMSEFIGTDMDGSEAHGDIVAAAYAQGTQKPSAEQASPSPASGKITLAKRTQLPMERSEASA